VRARANCCTEGRGATTKIERREIGILPIAKADNLHTEQKLTFTYQVVTSDPPSDQLIIDLSSSESDQSDSHNDSTDEEVGAGNNPFHPDDVGLPFNEVSERG